MQDNINKILDSIFLKEEVDKVNEAVTAILFLSVLNKVDSVLDPNDANMFNNFIKEEKIDKALSFLKDKGVDFKNLVAQSQEELTVDLSQKLGVVLENSNEG